MTSIEELETQLKNKLERRDFTNVADEDVEDEIKRAIRTINRHRHFDATEDKPYDPKYEDLIIPLAVCAFSKIGAEGESSHSENGIVRSYTSGGDYPSSMLDEIIPLIK